MVDGTEPGDDETIASAAERNGNGQNFVDELLGCPEDHCGLRIYGEVESLAVNNCKAQGVLEYSRTHTQWYVINAKIDVSKVSKCSGHVDEGPQYQTEHVPDLESQCRSAFLRRTKQHRADYINSERDSPEVKTQAIGPARVTLPSRHSQSRDTPYKFNNNTVRRERSTSRTPKARDAGRGTGGERTGKSRNCPQQGNDLTSPRS
ncbi:hypothetical protein WN55_07129 [Dufourea novaeangliae]|uniref:Uncharacterized protein n=1 Tax=Dufourea novaeangliae TaxID=178035 RepID=A0A154P2I1_DUFNO|nr:hypothetical protein WN55_07129 [Dufourea novaeangliae]